MIAESTATAVLVWAIFAHVCIEAGLHFTTFALTWRRRNVSSLGPALLVREFFLGLRYVAVGIGFHYLLAYRITFGGWPFFWDDAENRIITYSIVLAVLIAASSSGIALIHVLIKEQGRYPAFIQRRLSAPRELESAVHE